MELGQEHYDGDNDDSDGRVVDYGVVAQVPAPAATTPCDLSLLSPPIKPYLMFTIFYFLLSIINIVI